VTVRAAVFASGRGSNFQVLAERAGRGGPWEVRLLVTDKEDAGALDRAEALGVPSRVVPVADRSPDQVGRDLLAALDEPRIDFVLLAGYMRLVPPAVVRAPARVPRDRSRPEEPRCRCGRAPSVWLSRRRPRLRRSARQARS
jgi:folate-dependent phosphoribosylglycinamide formyltransferase PurN